MQEKRVNLFMGHYGSGKTNIAVNFALNLAKKGNTTIYDLDIVNPYFRTVDAFERLKKGGVDLIVSPFAETNVDIPAMESACYKMVDDLNSFAVVDIGGDERGSLALGRFAEKIKAENKYDMFLVVNLFRPLTRDLQGIQEIKEEIESTCKIKFTGLINNTNLGEETSVEDVCKSCSKLEEICDKIKLPYRYTAVKEDLFNRVKDKVISAFPIELIKYGEWML